MKVALVSRGYSLSHGGAEAVTVNLSRALSRAGHDVTVYAERIEENTEGIDTVKVDIKRGLTFFRGTAFHKKVSAMLKGNDFDVVFGFCPFYPVDVYRASGGVHAHWMNLRYPNKIARAVKYLLSPGNIAIDKLERDMFKGDRCRYVITNSLLAKEHFVKYFGLADDRVTVVYNGVDGKKYNSDLKKHRAEVRKELGIGEEESVVLYVSNNWKRKGLVTAVKAMQGLDGLTMIVAGRGKESEFDSIVGSTGVDRDKVKLVGQRKDIERFYGASDFFVLPTQYDPCANVCMEAMASGLPVITTMENGASEFITNDYNGFIIESWRDVMLLQQYYYTLMDSRVSENMGQNAELTMKRYTWEKTMEETLKVCEDAVSHKKAVGK